MIGPNTRSRPRAETTTPTAGINLRETNFLPLMSIVPKEKAGAIPSSLDLQKPPTTKQATSHHPSTQMWPSPSTNLEVLRVIGYRTIFGRGYDEKNEFWFVEEAVIDEDGGDD
ncbi:hypothetical protein SNK05_005967 [Fusarium graminearum]